MAKEKEATVEEMLAGELDDREKKLADREQAVQQESSRLAQLESRVEAAAAKVELAASKATGEYTEQTIASTAGKGGRTFRVLTTSPAAHERGLRSIVVTDCCDESEAVRCALARFGITETYHVKCTAQPVEAAA